MPLSILSSSFSFNKRSISRIFLTYTILPIIGFIIYTIAFYSKQTDFIEETVQDLKNIPELAKELKLLRKGDRLLIWGYAPLFYFYFYKECQLRPASRFILLQASISGYIQGNKSSYKEGFESKRYIIKRYREELIEDLITNKPELIVDTSPLGFHHWDRYGLNTFPELKGFINDGYYLFKDINGFHLYLRR